MFEGFPSRQALNFALLMIAFAIPMPFIFSPLSIICFAILWVLQVKYSTLIYNLKTRKILWLWVIFYLLHALSYFYSIDKHESISDLGQKMSFIVLPLLIGVGISVDKDLLKRTLLSFILSLNIISVFCLARAILIYFHTGATTQFFYHPLVSGLDANAVYYGIYALFSISALLFFPWDNFLPKYLRILFTLIHLVFFILLSSRTLIVVFFIVVLPLYIRSTFLNRQRSLLLPILLSAFFILLAFILFRTNNPIKTRYADILSRTEKVRWGGYKDIANKKYNNLSIRLFIWHIGINNIREHNLWWIGAGNGSIHAIQNKKMDEYGVRDIYNEKNRSSLYDVNLHNMYLQTLIMLGLPGLFVFLLIVLLPFWYARYSNIKIFIYIFNFAMAVLMAQESSLQTQAGIVFYTFFSILTYNYVVSERRTGQNTQHNLFIPVVRERIIKIKNKIVFFGSALQNLRKPSIVSLGFLFSLLTGAFIFYKERLFFADASFIAFNIINNKSLCIQEHRYGSFITQVVPYLGQKFHFPIKAILIAYAVSFNLFYLLIASLIVFVFKQYRLAILMALYYFLFVSDSYFWTNNEIHQGIAWMFLFFAITIHLGIKNANIFLFLISFLLFGFLTISSHFLTIIPLTFLWVYYMIEKTHWPFSKKRSISLSALLVLIIIIKFMIGHADIYDGKDLHNILHASVKDIAGSLSTPVVQMFLYRCVVNYWTGTIVFLISVIILLKNKNKLLLVWMLSSCLGYFIFMGLVFGGYGKDFLLFYVETEWQSISILIAAPFVFAFLPKLKPYVSVSFLTVIFITRLAYISKAIPEFAWRIHFKEHVMKEMKKSKITKLALYWDENYPKCILDWAFPYETLLESAMNGDKPQLTFCYINKGDSRSLEQLRNRNIFFGPWETIRSDKLNADYFETDTTMPYQIMPFKDLDISYDILNPPFFDAQTQSVLSDAANLTTIDSSYFKPEQVVMDFGKKAIVIWSKNVVSKPVFFAKGNYKIAVLSYGTPVNGIFPHNSVYINDRKIGEFFSTSEYSLHPFVFEQKRDTTIKIKIDMDNDAKTITEDRNTFIQCIYILKTNCKNTE